MYSIKDVSFTYNSQNRKTVDNISFDISEKTIHLILGGSGSGKSSLINILAGIVPFHIEGNLEGDFLYNGENLIHMPLKDRAKRVGIVFQDADTQFCTLKVIDEIVFALENLKFPPAEMQAIIDRSLKILDIEHLKYRELSKLSGGEKQKVAIASVLALDPQILIFDEPTANLDPVSTKAVFEILRKLRDVYGKTVLVVEHKLEHLIQYADAMTIIDNGRLIFSGSQADGISFLANTNTVLDIHLPKAIEIYKNLGLHSKRIPLSCHDLANVLRENCVYPSVLGQKQARSSLKTTISAREVQVKYGNANLLKNINLEGTEGMSIAILGHNGAGKTTLLNALANLNKEYSGKIEVLGKDAKKYKRAELWSYLGIAFQNPEWQFLTYSIIDELNYSLKKSKLNKDEKTALIEENLRFFNLTNEKHQNPFLLSQGQKRRLSVACMMVTNQKILLLDEPTFGQDYKNQKELMEKMKLLNKKGVTLILTTHDMDLVLEYCDYCYVLQGGEIVFDGHPEKLFGQEEILTMARLEKPFMFELTELMRKDDVIEGFIAKP